MGSQEISSISAVLAPAQSAAQRTDGVGRAVEPSHAVKPPEQTKAQEPPRPQRDQRSLHYQVDGATHRIVATIVDDNNTVIRQIPDAEVLRIAREIDRMQGFLVEAKA